MTYRDSSFESSDFIHGSLIYRQTLFLLPHPGEDGSQGAHCENEQQDLPHCQSHVVRNQPRWRRKQCDIHTRNTFAVSGFWMNSRWVYEHLHQCDEEEHYHAAAEGRAAPLLLLGGVTILQLGVYKTQWHRVDLMILHSEEHKYENKPLS